jgi:hypothetical protein
MSASEKFINWVIDELLKNTYIEKYKFINFITPKGIIHREGENPYFYDDTIHMKYGIPDDYQLMKTIETTYVDILLDLESDYDMYRWKFKNDESVYDHLMRNKKKPLKEFDEKYRKFVDSVTDDLIQKTKWEKFEGFSSDDDWTLFHLPFKTKGGGTYRMAYNNGMILRLSMVLSIHSLLLDDMVNKFRKEYGLPGKETNEAMLIYWDKLMMEIFGEIDIRRMDRPRLV